MHFTSHRHVLFTPLTRRPAHHQRSNQFLFCFPHFNCQGAFHPQAQRVFLLCHRSGKTQHFSCFRSVPLTAVVSHIVGGLSSTSWMSFLNPSSSRAWPHHRAIPGFASISSVTSVSLVFTHLCWREVVSHSPWRLSSVFALSFANSFGSLAFPAAAALSPGANVSGDGKHFACFHSIPLTAVVSHSSGPLSRGLWISFS